MSTVGPDDPRNADRCINIYINTDSVYLRVKTPIQKNSGKIIIMIECCFWSTYAPCIVLVDDKLNLVATLSRCSSKSR